LERGTCGKEFGMVKQTLTSYPILVCTHFPHTFPSPFLDHASFPKGKKRENWRERAGRKSWLVKSKTEQLDPKEKKGKKGHMGFIY
jgi:hypothetical protein